MMALAVDGTASPPKSDLLLGKIRPGLLALKQFEPVYVLARWIRSFFMNTLNRSEPRGTDSEAPDAQVPAEAPAVQQPITPQSVPHVPQDSDGQQLPAEMGYTVPMSMATPDFHYDAGGHVGECPSRAADMGGFWPTSLTHGVFSNGYTSDAMEFPQPDSLQYQAMYFLADLGIAGSE